MNHSQVDLLIRDGCYQEALHSLGKWPQSVERDWRLSLCFLKQKNYSKAQSMLRHLSIQYPEHSDILVKLGIADHGLNRLGGALKSYLMAIRSAGNAATLSDALMQYAWHL